MERLAVVVAVPETTFQILCQLLPVHFCSILERVDARGDNLGSKRRAHAYPSGGCAFPAAEVRWDEDYERLLAAKGHLVRWPGDFFTQPEIEDWGADAPKKIMEKDKETIGACDVVVALHAAYHDQIRDTSAQ